MSTSEDFLSLEKHKPAPTPTSSTSSQLDYHQLSSGRYVSYASYGPAHGRPVLFFHGFPGSRLEGALWQETAIRLQARLIVPDRPGMSFSSFQPGRRILDWPRDVLELAAHLKMQRFYLLATSGGSPYVLACLREIPPSRILGASIVSGIFPLSLGAEDMLFMSRVGLFIAVWFTPILAFLLDIVLGRPARARNPAAFERIFMRDMEQRPEIDRRCLKNEEYKGRLLDCVRESLRFRTYGFVWEARLLGSNWGFDLDEIVHEGLTLWQGKQDANCPVSMAERATARLKGARLSVLDEGHLSLAVNHQQEILEGLLRSAE